MRTLVEKRKLVSNGSVFSNSRIRACACTHHIFMPSVKRQQGAVMDSLTFILDQYPVIFCFVLPNFVRLTVLWTLCMDRHTCTATPTYVHVHKTSTLWGILMACGY